MWIPSIASFLHASCEEYMSLSIKVTEHRIQLLRRTRSPSITRISIQSVHDLYISKSPQWSVSELDHWRGAKH